VPGVVVPPTVLERMRAAGDGEKGQRTGIEIARETLVDLPGLVEGVQVATPLGSYERALAVVDGFMNLDLSAVRQSQAKDSGADGRPGERTERPSSPEGER
jgi:hypothetical protein